MSSRHGRVSLQRFELQGVHDTGRTIGNGSYATVKELEFRGLECVGKKIHRILYKAASPQERAAVQERFADECELLSRLHHPCIVQFLGVYFEGGRDPQFPVLVMEYLHTTLSACLHKYGVLPEEISYTILRDVALGLRYLHEHTPAVIHRDLSANNVLLATNMRAKISDLGVAKILNLSPAQTGLMTHTQTPGTPCYMPPEAMVARPKYTSKVDIFSYGVMMVHVLSSQWPLPGDVFRADPANPSVILPVTEFERRAEYTQEIKYDHPLMGLIHQCLSNAPETRPDASKVLHHVETAVSQRPPLFENKVEMMKQIEVQKSEIESQKKAIDVLRSKVGKVPVQSVPSPQSVTADHLPSKLRVPDHKPTMMSSIAEEQPTDIPPPVPPRHRSYQV